MNLSEARAEAAKWGNLIRALAKVQDVIEEAGSQEQAKDERARVLAGINAGIEAGNATLERVKTEAENLMASAKARAESMIAEARAQADSHLASAKGVLEQARSSAQKALQERDTHVALRDAAHSELQNLKGELARVKQQFADAIEEARKRFGAAAP